MKTKMTPLEECRELSNRVSNALSQMKRLDNFNLNIKDSEVKFRYEAITGMLLIAQNDIFGMLQEWKK